MYQSIQRTFAAGCHLTAVLAASLITTTLAADISGELEIADVNARLIANKEVFLMEATTGGPLVRGSAKTDDSGAFTIVTDADVTNSVFYLSVDVRPRVRYLCAVGGVLPETATINEFTSIAASYAYAQFLRTGEISGDPFALYIASQMHDNLANPVTGEISEVLLTPPNADETNSLKMFRTLANVLNRCALNPFIASAVLNITKEPGERRPGDTATAFANLARNPGQNVERLYRLSRWRQTFQPVLEEAPDAWCITVKVNDAGGVGAQQMFAGPANVAFDEWGYAWIPNNVTQGSPNSGDYLVVLQPNGKPADGADGGPVSPITGGGIKGGGWGVAIGPDDFVWASNFGWGGNQDGNWPQLTPEEGTGSVSVINAENGNVISQPSGLYGGVWRAQAIEVEDNNDVWIASLQNDRAVLWPNGNPANAVWADFYERSEPFGILPTGDGEAWVTLSGGLAGDFQASLAKVRYNESESKLETTYLQPVGDTLRVIAEDSYGNVWIASNGDSSVYAFDENGNQLGRFQGGGIDGPWGICIDGEDNVWVANFGDIEFINDYGPGRITKLYGANPDNRPRRAKLGDPISPETGYTVLSGGDPVTLANGDPLYGPDGPPSFTPMSRQTSLQIDAAGNIWSINNWKPSDFEDRIRDNPGGDGVVIFVGIAPPPTN